MIDPAPIRDRFTALSSHLNEPERRLFAATEAAAAGYGGIAAVSAATGIAVITKARISRPIATPLTFRQCTLLLAGVGREGFGHIRRAFFERQ